MAVIVILAFTISDNWFLPVSRLFDRFQWDRGSFSDTHKGHDLRVLRNRACARNNSTGFCSSCIFQMAEEISLRCKGKYLIYWLFKGMELFSTRWLNIALSCSNISNNISTLELKSRESKSDRVTVFSCSINHFCISTYGMCYIIVDYVIINWTVTTYYVIYYSLIRKQDVLITWVVFHHYCTRHHSGI